MGSLLNALPYSINYVEVAQYNVNTDSWGTPKQFRYAQGFQPDPQLDDDILKNKGASERALSILTHYEGTIMGAGIDAEVLAIIDSTSNTLAGTAGSYIRTLDIYGGDNAPYFGMIVHMPIDGGGVALWGFPFCQVSTRLNFDMEQNQFALPEFTFNALRLRTEAGVIYPIARVKEYEAGQPSLPTTFSSFFV